MATRRQFIERIAVAGGYGAAYNAMRALGMAPEVARAAPLQIARAQAGASVVVLGAGIAGLVSAWELNEAGYDVTLVEARDRVGGRNWSVRRGTKISMTDGSEQTCEFSEGEYFNAGPARLPSHHQTMLGYCRRFGVALETEVNQSRSAFLQTDRVNGGKPFRVRQAMADTRGHVSELLAKSINRGRLNDALTADDRERMVEFLRNYGDLNHDFAYTGSTRAGYRTEPMFDRGVAVDPLPMHELLDADMWISILFDELIDWQATMMQPVGGMDQIPHAFEARLGSIVRRGIEVTEIRQGPRGVTVGTRERANGQVGSITADYAICTLPLNILAGLDADFSPAWRAAMKRVKYDESTKVAFEAPRFWEADQIYGGISYVSGDTGVVWYPSHGFQQPTGIVLGAYASGIPATRLGQMDVAGRIGAARQAVDRVHPGCGRLLTRGVNVLWSKIPYSMGPWAKEWGEEDGNDPADFRTLSEPDGRIYLATANLSATPGWQEGAAHSAHRAVTMIGQRASREQKI